MYPFGNSVWHVLHNLNYLLRVPIPVIAIYVICAINSKRVLRQESVKERKLHTLEQLNFDQLWKCRLSWSELRFHSRGLNMCVSVTYTCCVWLFSQFQPFGVQKPQKMITVHFALSCFFVFVTLWHCCVFLEVLLDVLIHITNRFSGSFALFCFLLFSFYFIWLLLFDCSYSNILVLQFTCSCETAVFVKMFR